MSPAWVTAASVFLAGIAIRDGYELLKLRHGIDPTDVRVFAFVFASMCVMWVSWFTLGVMDGRTLPLPAIVRWGGLLAVAAGVFLAVGGMWELRGVENIDHLVTSGVFSVFRHPMYVGFALWILGWAAFHAAPASLAVGLAGLVSIAWWRRLEERDLGRRYGDEYRDYRAATWF